MKKALIKIRKIIQNLTDYIPPEAKSMLPMAGIALLAVVLIIIIVIAQSCGAGKAKEPETEEIVFEDVETETISAFSDPDEDEGQITDTLPSTEAEEDYGSLTKNGDPELLAVMTRYFTARANADLDTINELYGITDASSQELAEDQEVLQFNAKYISSFDDITTYVMDGPYSDSWLVYTTTDISFYTCSTKAPTIMWCYIEKDDDGEYHILDSHRLTNELNEYAEEENHTPEVRALAADINTRLLEALESDPELEETYGILRSGSPLWENTDEAETAVAVIEEEEEEPVRETARQTEADEDEDEESDEETETEETSVEQETITPFGNDTEAAAQEPGAGAEVITAIENPGGPAGVVEEAGPAGELVPIEAENAD